MLLEYFINGDKLRFCRWISPRFPRYLRKLFSANSCKRCRLGIKRVPKECLKPPAFITIDGIDVTVIEETEDCRPSDPDFQPLQCCKPHWITQPGLSDLVKDLN